MKTYEATEQAYKNGYEKGKADAMKWIPVTERLPEDNDEQVLVIANGKPQENITLIDAYELAEYSAEDGWIIEAWPEWEGANVTHWMPLPPAPEDLK